MFEFNDQTVRKEIGAKVPGIYKLLNSKGDVKRLGMSVDDLQSELLMKINPRFTHFDYKITGTDKAAWQQLCEAWHFHSKNDFLDNEDHVQPPKGKYWTCHVCEDKSRY